MLKNQLNLKDYIVLAPMAGVSDVGFRALASKYGADATWSEMLSCRAMMHNPKKTEFMTICAKEEKEKIAQIFGHEPEIMASSLSLELLKDYDVFDINMGCPAPKIVKNGEGSALMKNLPLASKIISSCAKATDKPLGVKFRLGFDNDISREFGRMCEESGADFITLHARTTAMGYSGRADYEAIAKLKASVKIPVIGNGDVVDKTSFDNMKATGVDSVMIGRGACGRPWIFDELKNNPLPKDKFEVVRRHVEILRQHYEEKWLTMYLRKHFLWYVYGIEGAAEKRLQLATSESIDKSLQILKDILK